MSIGIELHPPLHNPLKLHAASPGRGTESFESLSFVGRSIAQGGGVFLAGASGRERFRCFRGICDPFLNGERFGATPRFRLAHLSFRSFFRGD